MAVVPIQYHSSWEFVNRQGDKTQTWFVVAVCVRPLRAGYLPWPWSPGSVPGFLCPLPRATSDEHGTVLAASPRENSARAMRAEHVVPVPVRMDDPRRLIVQCMQAS